MHRHAADDQPRRVQIEQVLQHSSLFGLIYYDYGFQTPAAYADSLRLAYTAPDEQGHVLAPEQVEALVRKAVPEAFS